MKWNVDNLELVWTLFALGAFIIVFASYRSAVRGMHWAEADSHGAHDTARYMIAQGHVRTERFRMAKVTIGLVVAVAAISLAPPPPSYDELPQSVAGIYAWIGFFVLLIMESVTAHYWNGRIRQTMNRRAQDKGKPATDRRSGR